MILCLVMDAEGRPVCTEMWPGNTADVSVLLPVVDRLRHRFGIGRVCVVADRGMISEATIAGLEGREHCSRRPGIRARRPRAQRQPGARRGPG
jgi:transposase